MSDAIIISELGTQETTITRCTGELRWRSGRDAAVLEQKWEVVSSETGVSYEWHPIPEVSMPASEEE